MPSRGEWEAIRNFTRTYLDPSRKLDLNTIKVSQANTYEHNLRVCQICLTLLEAGIPFYTEATFKTGWKPDIVCPTHSYPIIEVFHTEDSQKFTHLKSHKVPIELQDEILFNRTENPFQKQQVL